MPVLFVPYAEDLVARVAALAPGRVLEVACGTGIVTRRLLERLPAGTQIVATERRAGAPPAGPTKIRSDPRAAAL